MSSVFDLDGVRRRLDNDIELLIELVGIFFDGRDQALSSMGRAISIKSAKELYEQAHSVKGALNNIGANSSGELAFALERMGRDGSLAQAESTLTLLRQEIDKFKLEFDRFTTERDMTS